MIKEFEQLSQDEIALLVKAPAIISVLASIGAGEINKWEKADAIKLAQVKTFTARPKLIPYYKEVEKNFERNFEMIAKQYSPFDEKNKYALKREVYTIYNVIEKLNSEFAVELRASLRKFAEHVKKAYKGLVVNFLFPFPIPGLTE
jgi:hypothetical protein